jgi:three-Cys-motif partner protein
MPVHKFGGGWTTEKLERVRKYLVAYTTIFARNPRAQKLTPIYVDAFAGTGYRSKPRSLDAETPLFAELTEADTDAFLKGSAQIALEIDPPFKQYLFIEQDAEHAKELEKLKIQFPDQASAIRIVPQDANAFLKRWCADTDWRV